MARINLDDKLKSDVRFDLLAAQDELITALQAQATWRRRLVIGAITDLWFYCYHMGDVVTEEVLAACMQVPGELAADMLIEAGLATVVTRARSRTKPCRLLRIKGVRQRAKYLREQSEKGRNGGVRSGESRRSKRASKNPPSASGNHEANVKPPDPVPDLAPDPAPAPPPDPAPDSAASGRQRSSGPPAEVYEFKRGSGKPVGVGYGDPPDDDVTQTGFLPVTAKEV